MHNLVCMCIWAPTTGTWRSYPTYSILSCNQNAVPQRVDGQQVIAVDCSDVDAEAVLVMTARHAAEFRTWHNDAHAFKSTSTVDGRNPVLFDRYSLSHYLQGFIHPRWCRISSVNSRTSMRRSLYFDMPVSCLLFRLYMTNGSMSLEWLRLATAECSADIPINYIYTYIYIYI